ncbi:MAG TPA: hypothetical protein VHS79_22785 [Actinomycetes bacterium]|nr:hypothetical protein [Actinomycetes bacterium]
MTATSDVRELVNRWAEAERGNDAEALDGLLADAHIGFQDPAGAPAA